jgi:hypothetical protein
MAFCPLALIKQRNDLPLAIRQLFLNGLPFLVGKRIQDAILRYRCDGEKRTILSDSTGEIVLGSGIPL